MSLQALELKKYVPLERCRLVKYDEYSETLDQSFEEQEVGRRCGLGRGRGGEDRGEMGLVGEGWLRKRAGEERGQMGREDGEEGGGEGAGEKTCRQVG